MLRIQNRDAERLTTTSLSEEGFEEDDLREWIIGRSGEVLDEELLIIGRETGVAGIGDGIDILAVDRSGNMVVVELKRGELREAVDFQALKYASYISRWSYDDIKQQFETFLQSKWGEEIHGDDAGFSECIQEFCDDDYELNAQQRVFLVGSTVRERIGSVVLWLREQDIDVSIVQFSLLKDADGGVFLDSKTLVPTSDLEKFETGESPTDDPWKQNGERWHLEEQSNEETAALVQELVSNLEDIAELTGPSWTQKVYIAFRTDGTNRVLLRTQANSVILDAYDFSVNDEDEVVSNASRHLKDEQRVSFEPDYKGDRSRIRLKCKPEDDLDVGKLVSFVRDLLFGE